MAVFRRGKIWWYEFTFAGKRVRESAKTSRKTIASEAEKRRRLELERAFAGMPSEAREQRIDLVKDRTALYLKAYAVNHRRSTLAYCKSCLKNIDHHLGGVMLSDLSEARIIEYMKIRQEAGAGGSTINSELGELSRAIGQPWKLLWPRVRGLEKRRDVGVALSPEQEKALLVAAEKAAKLKKGIMMPTLIRLALLTGMRAAELTSLRWGQTDTEAETITVGKAKTAAGQGRILSMNTQIRLILEAHLAWWTKRFGEAKPDLCVFPFGSPQPKDPTRPVTTLKHTWEAIREAAGVDCRWHDLRHTFCTKLAERGVPESTMLSLMGHMSRAMLERYSHIRMAAKRAAVEGMTLPDVSLADLISVGVPTKSPTKQKQVTIQ